MSTDASAWLLDRYDDGEAPRTNWTRPLFQVLRDYSPLTSEDAPVLGEARATWPVPTVGDDLDMWDDMALRRERNTGPAAVRGLDGRRLR